VEHQWLLETYIKYFVKERYLNISRGYLDIVLELLGSCDCDVVRFEGGGFASCGSSVGCSRAVMIIRHVEMIPDR
jgi:hypothetical protein